MGARVTIDQLKHEVEQLRQVILRFERELLNVQRELRANQDRSKESCKIQQDIRS